MKERYEAEIEQILQDLDTPPPGEEPARRELEIPPDDLPSPFAPAPAAPKRRISPGKLAVVGIIVAVVGMVAARGVVWLPVAGLAIIGIAVAWTFLRRYTAPSPPVWRGRPVDPPAAPPATGWQRVRRWWDNL